MIETCDAGNGLEEVWQVAVPSPLEHFSAVFVVPHHLCSVHHAWVINHLGNVWDARDWCFPILLLNKTKGPIRQKLGVPWHHETTCKCFPVRTLHMKYQMMKLFLFCPVQLSACRSACSSPSPQLEKKWSSKLIISSDPFWMRIPIY